MELLDEKWSVGEVGGAFPGDFAGSIPFPVDLIHEDLLLVPSDGVDAAVEDVLYFVFEAIVEFNWFWR